MLGKDPLPAEWEETSEIKSFRFYSKIVTVLAVPLQRALCKLCKQQLRMADLASIKLY